MLIPVDLGSRSYSIVVEPGALTTVGARLRELGVGSRAVLVTDAGILKHHGAAVLASLEAAGLSATVLEIPEGETAKTLAVAEHCWDRLLAAGVDRTSTVLALGGGAVGDLAGFVAATYMRGTNFVPLPTTVLAQVDASSGGKTAIDHPKAKNLIGAFHQPRLVVVDPAVVLTLPDRDFRSGLAEIVKHGIVLDAGYFEDVERSATALSARDLPTLTRIIAGSCRLKAGVIQRDPEEKGEWRFALNYGHTIGHALEAATGFETWTHGEAVSLGIVAEARLAERLGVADASVTRRQEALLRTLALPVRAGALHADAVVAAIAHDKKARNGRVPFVLAPAIGSFRVVYDVSPNDVRAALTSLSEAER
jgi:3-dehydroquinate synthase